MLLSPAARNNDRRSLAGARRAFAPTPRFGRSLVRCGGLLAVCWAALLLVPAPAQAGGGPENVLVVVNSASWASQAVANEFIRLRKIPPGNVFYLDWDGGCEEIDVEDFRQQILGQVLKAIDDRGLSDQIDYIVYSSDFPNRVNLSRDLHGQKVPAQQTPVGSLSALTYLWQLVMAKSPAVISLHNNQYMRSTTGRVADPPLHGFRDWYGWGPEGELLETGGTRYMLSTVLAVTSGRGNSVAEAISYLRRSARADGTFPEGTIYYMENEDVRSTTRSGGFAAALVDLNFVAVKGVVLPGSVPIGKRDVQGLMMGSAQIGWPASGSTILPGAICEHLTSSGGVLDERAGQAPLTEFLRYGAAGSSGTVVEPYALADKFPVPHMHFYYACGCTLAEAYYQSVFGPYQLLIVGDPLCRPWANIPRVTAGSLKADESLHGTVEIKAGATFAAKPSVGGDRKSLVDRYELFVDGHRSSRGNGSQPLELDTASLADGYHEIRLVAIESGAIETQGRAILPVNVSNREHTIEFTASPAGKVRWDQKLVLSAKAPGMSAVAFFHNGRIIGKVPKAEGQVSVDPRIFGTGPITLRAVGLARGGAASYVHAKPIEMEVLPSEPLAPLKDVDPAKLVRGLQLTLASGSMVPVQETFKPEWLAEAGVKPRQTFEMRAYFSAKETEMYQFQVWHLGDLKLAVDGQLEYEGVKGNYRQRFVPVTLAAGWHQLTITGHAGDEAKLRVLFGGPGAYSLDGVRFRHVPK